MSENQYKTIVPVAKIRTIMKSSADVGAITQEAIQLVARSTELFISNLAENAHKEQMKNKEHQIVYKHLANYVQNESKLEFLQQMLPKKITVKQYKELLRKSTEKEALQISSSDDDDESVSSSESSSDDSGNADDAISISSASVIEVKN
ncbi:Chromatin accessibility complex 16kD protein [Sergentomyia squamirostris]